MSSSTPFQIAIVGGGIAGMAAAISMSGPNRKIIIFEQSRLSSEIGATISLQPNATRILKHTWNLDDVLEKASGMVDHGFRVYNVEGTRVNEIPLKSKTQYGADRIMWHRQDLHSYLKTKALASSTTELRTSSRVTDCNADSGLITLENGEQIRADLIIAADGIHSFMRSIVLNTIVEPKPTGLSAYRLMMHSSMLQKKAPQFFANINPRDPYTSMIMAHDCRLIMGPARDGELYSVVGLVPDEQMNEEPDSAQSWVREGDRDKMLDTFHGFPDWTKEMLKLADSIGLWQLRDLDPLGTWTRGRVILIGDAAHAMLPTQGQGASQAIEDAEALGAFFADISEQPSVDQVTSILDQVFKCRYDRATLIQQFSRQSAKPATEQGSNVVKLRPDEFMDYNCMYRGAKEWLQQEKSLFKDGRGIAQTLPINQVQAASA